MSARVMGVETEYTFAALDSNNQRISSGVPLTRLLDLVRDTHATMYDRTTAGMFLGNGSRFYIDCGHPELATPEVQDPWTLCRYILSGDVMMERLVREMTETWDDVADVIVARSNVSYGPQPTTWGCHESYGYQTTRQMGAHIIKHLVTRPLLTGGGGFDAHSPGIEFLITPRVVFLEQAVSAQSTRERGIFHTKNESLSRGDAQRMHLICGEGVCSQTSMWLKAATTTLVVAAIEAGCEPANDLSVCDPVALMRSVSRDVDVNESLDVGSGRSMTAIEIQRRYLQCVSESLGAPSMPPWAGEAVEMWRSILDRLEQGVDAVDKTLDWAIKLAVYRRRAAASGVDWDALPHWNDAIKSLWQAAKYNQGLPFRSTLTSEFLSRTGPIGETVHHVSERLEHEGLDYERISDVLKLRSELFELDMRFSQVGPRGIFNALDKSGVLDHRVPGVQNIESAVHLPPSQGRARVRGETIRSLKGAPYSACCDWFSVWDFGNRRTMELPEPLDEKAKWTDSDDSGRLYLSAGDVPMLQPAWLMAEALRHFDAGRYERARAALERAGSMRTAFVESQSSEFQRYRLWVECRRGSRDWEQALEALYHGNPTTLTAVCNHAIALRYFGLQPDPAIDDWIEKGLAMIDSSTDSEAGTCASFLDHCGRRLMAQDRIVEALEMIERARRYENQSHLHAHVKARLISDQAEALRRAGDVDRARERLAEVAAIQHRNNFEGEFADNTLTTRARLAANSDNDPDEALKLLARARSIQTRLQNRMGLARTLALEARLSPDAAMIASHQRRLVELQETVPALESCRLTARVLDGWTKWTGGVTPSDATDEFWGV